MKESVFFGGCGDSYLVDMETKIAGEWKRTVSLPLRLCSMLKKMEGEWQSKRSERTRGDRKRRALKNYKGSVLYKPTVSHTRRLNLKD